MERDINAPQKNIAAWKEFFEDRGWKFQSEFNGELKMEKGDVWKDDGQGAFMSFFMSDKRLRIITTDKGYGVDGPNRTIKYFGKCLGDQHYKLICELIEFK